MADLAHIAPVVPLFPMPVGFRWLERRRLAGVATPGLLGSPEQDLRGLAMFGIQTLVVLDEDLAFPRGAASTRGIELVHLGVPEDGAPSVIAAWAVCLDIELRVSRGKPVAIASTHGLGRVGTLLTAYEIFCGRDPLHALAKVRAVEPRYVRTDAQRAFLLDFARMVYARESEAVRTRRADRITQPYPEAPVGHR